MIDHPHHESASSYDLFTFGPNSQVRTFESQEIMKVWFLFIKSGSWLVWRVGSSFLLNPTFNTSPKTHLQTMLLHKHPCHTWDTWFGIPCEVVSPNFHALNGWDCTNWLYMTWDLCELALTNYSSLWPSSLSV